MKSNCEKKLTKVCYIQLIQGIWNKKLNQLITKNETYKETKLT